LLVSFCVARDLWNLYTHSLFRQRLVISLLARMATISVTKEITRSALPTLCGPLFLQGDSGGPLISTEDNRGEFSYLIGIVSFGSKTCGGGGPTVYVRLTGYLDWILEHISWHIYHASNGGAAASSDGWLSITAHYIFIICNMRWKTRSYHFNHGILQSSPRCRVW
jgi:hypothetical protein